jgi:RND family efflux transporter MFP subunit
MVWSQIMIRVVGRCLFLAAAVLLPTIGLAQVAPELPPTKEAPSSEAPSSEASTGLTLNNSQCKAIDSISVAAPVQGLMDSIHVREGTRVKKGDLLAAIEDAEDRLKLEKANLAKESAARKALNDIDERMAEKGRQVAETEYRNVEEANRDGSNTYSPREVRRLKLVFDRSELELERAAFLREINLFDLKLAENECRQIEDRLSKHRIVAPCDGTVVSVEKRPGEWLEAGATTFEIVNTNPIRIEGFIPLESASESLLGTIADVEATQGKTTHRTVARVVFLSLDANPVNGEVRVFLEADNPEGKLRPGMRPKTVLRSTP